MNEVDPKVLQDMAQSTVEFNAALAREYFAALDDRDLSRAIACWAPEGAVEAVPGARELTVPDGMRGFFEQLFGAFGELSIQVIHVTAQEDRAVVHWQMRARFTGPGRFDGFTPTQVQGAIQGLDQLTIQDGLIVRNDAYFDGMEMGRAIGLMPPAGSAPDRGMTALINLQTRVKRLVKRRAI